MIISSSMTLTGLPTSPSFASLNRLGQGSNTPSMQIQSASSPPLNKSITVGSKIKSRFFVKDRFGRAGNIEAVYFASSNVAVAQYDHARQVLSITFKSKGSPVYEYFQVPKQHWEAMKKASSIGRFVYYSVRKRYAYRRVR